MVILEAILNEVQILNAQQLVPEIIKAEYFKSGVDADVFRLMDVNGRQYALKKSRVNFFDHANDINQDDAALFRQEAEFARQVTQADISLLAPQIIFYHDNFLVMQFIEDDGGEVDASACIGLLSALHRTTKQINLAFLPISHEGYHEVEFALADRMLRRVENLKAYIDIDFSWLSRQMIVDIIQADENQNCLLHMDCRRNNLLKNNGRIYIIDWANALVGSPLLEIARLEVYGELGVGLLQKYQLQNPHLILNELAHQIYSLDTVIMMNLVFLSSAPNAKKAVEFEIKLRKIIKTFL